MRVEPRLFTSLLLEGDVFLFLKGAIDMINIVFPDGNEKEFPVRTTGEDIAQSISPGLRRQALAIKLNGELVDLRRPLEQGGKIEIITYQSQERSEEHTSELQSRGHLVCR